MKKSILCLAVVSLAFLAISPLGYSTEGDASGSRHHQKGETVAKPATSASSGHREKVASHSRNHERHRRKPGSEFPPDDDGIVVFGPKKYVRQKGRPVTQSMTFRCLDTTGDFTLIIRNGDPSGKHRVTGATIAINEQIYADTADFNRHTGLIEKDVELEQINQISVTLFGAPGSFLTVAIIAESAPAPAPVATFAADPASIVAGGSSTLSWSSTDADSCSIDNGIGEVNLSGSLSVSPAETTTYNIVATGPGGSTTASATVAVSSPPPLISFAADPSSVTIGETSTLSWQVDYADSIQIDQGIGSVDASGSLVVEPTEAATTYTLTAEGLGGSNTAQVNIQVTANVEPQPEGSFGAQYEDLIPLDATLEEYDHKRFALITGKVETADSTPLQGATISVGATSCIQCHGQKYGTVKTDANGQYTIPVEGGDTKTVVSKKEGFITSHRQVYVPWNDTAVTETIRMIPFDTAGTSINFDGDPATVVAHQSTPVSDDFGSRSATMVFTGDNHAYEVDAGGNVIRELTSITTRATEFATPETMPAKLPPNSAYTYCVEMSVDGVERVKFDKPVVSWVDNFLGFDVGEAVPVGYYDRDRGVWVPSDNGVVVRLLDTDSDGVADALDATGDGAADDLNGDGSFSDEVRALSDPVQYAPGNTYWRFAVTHFTPWDCNWPYGPPAGAIAPNAETDPEVDQQCKDCQTSINSFVEDRSRIFHEDIPIPGTDMTLHYAGNRVQGYKTRITVPVSGATVPASLKNIIVKVEIAGRVFESDFEPLPYLTTEYVWDGLDYLGRSVIGIAKAKVSIGFVYDLVYRSAGDFEQAFAQAGSEVTGIRGRQEIISWKRFYKDVRGISYGWAKGKGLIAEGWSLSNYHFLSPKDSGTLHKGDGTMAKNGADIIDTVAGNGIYGIISDGVLATQGSLRYVDGMAVDAAGNLYITQFGLGVESHKVCKVDASGIITTVAGNGDLGYSGDGGPATEASLNYPLGVAADAAGNLYIADTHNHRIRKVDANGIITTVAGTGVAGYSGDGGPATEAQLNRPRGITVDAAGNLYFVDDDNYRVRKVNTNGIITTVAGTGVAGYSNDGGLATETKLFIPMDVAVDSAGNLYIADYASARVRMVDVSGIITTVAGTGASGYSGDGGPADQARLGLPFGVAVDSADNLYITDFMNPSVRKVDVSGIITTVAGTGVNGYSGDGGPPTMAGLVWPRGVAVDSVGNLYIAESNNPRVRKVAPPSAFNSSFSAGDIPFAEENGLGHIMSSTGLHKTTIDLDTGVTLRTFGYDADNRLVTSTDQFGNVITINRDADGVPTFIVSPDGLTTQLAIDADGHLSSVTYPDGSGYAFEYTPEGLMTAEVDPNGNRFEHVFDVDGRVTDILDPEGGHWTFSRNVLDNGEVVAQKTTGEGDVTTYRNHSFSGVETGTITGPSGGVSSFADQADGLTETISLSCGTELALKYDLDPEYKFKYVKERTSSTPAGLSRMTQVGRTYQDTDADEVPDLITEAVAVNGKATTLTTNTLLAKRTATSPVGRTVTSFYDPATLVTTRLTIPGLDDVTYGYDSKGRLTSVNQGSRQSTFTYDAQGFLESVTDPESRTVTYDRDSLGRVTGIHRPDSSLVGFTYDDNGNMTVLTNPATVRHNFTYNGVDKQTAYQAPLSGSYQYHYDKDRRLTDVIFPSGRQISNLYSNGRLTQTQTPEGNIDYSYLCATKLGSVTMGTESLAYTYDASLVLSETSSGTLNQALQYTYNNDFQVTGFTYAGATESYSYDNDGLLTGAGSLTISRNADNGLPETVADSSYSLARSFSSYGEVAAENTTVSGQSRYAYSLTRNLAGQITARTETVAGANTGYAYTYDPAGRLLTVTKDDALVEEYRYDTVGRRTYEMSSLRGLSGTTLSYDDEDRLLSAGATSYQFNLDGFLTTKIEGADVTTYNYSSRGELLSATLPDGRVIEYVHDPLGRRIAKKVDGAIVEKYLWQGLTRLLAVYDGSDNLLMRFQYADGRMPVAMAKQGTTYYLGYDQVGTLRVVADSSCNIVKQIDYDSFGNILTDSNSAFTVPFGFAGGLHDRDTNLVRFGYRDYDPEIGRWTAKDPIRFAGGDVDLFGYVQNNPVNWADPWGLEGGEDSGLIPDRWGKLKAALRSWFMSAPGVAVNGSEQLMKPVPPRVPIVEAEMAVLNAGIAAGNQLRNMAMIDYRHYIASGGDHYYADRYQGVDWEKYGPDFDTAYSNYVKERMCGE